MRMLALFDCTDPRGEAIMNLGGMVRLSVSWAAGVFGAC
jgi:hypothetical protein